MKQMQYWELRFFWVITQRLVVIPSRGSGQPIITYSIVNNIFIFAFLTAEDGTDRLSRNVGKKLPLLAA